MIGFAMLRLSGAVHFSAHPPGIHRAFREGLDLSENRVYSGLPS
jgi:hypothetical protein